MSEKPTYRIVSGAPGVVECEVNQLCDTYAPIVWNIQAGQDGPLVTCIMISHREIMKAQLMEARMVGAGRTA